MPPIYRNKMEPRKRNGVNREKGRSASLLSYEGTRKDGNAVENCAHNVHYAFNRKGVR
jgi:hypothetical protein